jgi:NAD(P)-dependent dehydrogenase (short-subunit alcohol dehydrogenase family)
MPTRAHPVALVTGGANGIGRATARHLIDNGWRVGVLDLPGSGLHRAFPRGTRQVMLIDGDVGIEKRRRARSPPFSTVSDGSTHLSPMPAS